MSEIVSAIIWGCAGISVMSHHPVHHLSPGPAFIPLSRIDLPSSVMVRAEYLLSAVF